MADQSYVKSTRQYIRHGMTRSTTYRSWLKMKNRCGNDSAHNFKRYGGRGISICERWMNFENFLADLGERPPGMTIDRKDNNLGYEPGNCRWATPKQQQRNLRSNRLFDFHGEMVTAAEIKERTGCPFAQTTIRLRLLKGWSIDKALSTPAQHERKADEARSTPPIRLESYPRC